MKFGTEEIRKRIAEKILKIRKGERNGILNDETQEVKPLYNIDRGEMEYFLNLRGFAAFIKYVSTLPKKTIVDIGAGSTRAISEISKKPFSKGVKFLATILKRDMDIEKNLGYENTRITSVEVLRDIETGSIGGIFAVFSLPYVVDPKTAVRSIDRVLCKGGVIKMFAPAIDNKKDESVYVGNDYFGYEVFVNEFKELGYDCDYKIGEGGLNAIIVAKKPGYAEQLTAKTILETDYNIYMEMIGKMFARLKGD